MRNVYTAIFILLLVTGTELLAQKNTNSPYSRFGLGEMSRAGFEKSRAMGGIGLGMRDNDQINYIFDRIGRRGSPTLSFLSRDNPINVWLGKLRHRGRKR